jgi:hypothetical protein
MKPSNEWKWLIFLGSIVSILSIKAIADAFGGISLIFLSVPSSLWTLKQTTAVFFLLVIGIIVAYLLYKLGIGSISKGFIELRAIEAEININKKYEELMKYLEAKDGIKNKDNNTLRTSRRHKQKTPKVPGRKESQESHNNDKVLP